MLLTGEPALVSLSAAVLEAVMDHNMDAMSRLTSTGIFFFALAYCGSNLVELARLFHVRTDKITPHFPTPIFHQLERMDIRPCATTERFHSTPA